MILPDELLTTINNEIEVNEQAQDFYFALLVVALANYDNLREQVSLGRKMKITSEDLVGCVRNAYRITETP